MNETQDPPFCIRPMTSEERARVLAVMRRSFPPIQRFFFSLTNDVLLAEADEAILGVVVLKTVPLGGERRAGLLYWIFTAPEARGMGVASRLADAGLRALEDMGCTEYLGCVEGHNTSSSKLFAHRGFGILSPVQQFRRFGWGLFPLWVRIFHLVDFGHFVWARPGPETTDRPLAQWWGNTALNSLVAGLAAWRLSGFEEPILQTLGYALCSVLLLLGVRTVAMAVAARVQKFPLRFRIWESVLPLSLLISLAVGRWLPVPGSLYPTGSDWSYRERLNALGRISLAGTSTLLATAWTFSMLVPVLPPTLLPWVEGTIQLAKPLLIFDVVLAFFPFACFNSGRLWDWNRLLWLFLSIPAVLFYVQN